ncbi:MAG TPA: efflux RND transporter permease subunit [Micromonospora sp.]|nr:efflux RND transporter permease subunit [Micromonospora sp.]
MSLLARFSLANRSLVALVTVVIAFFGAFAIPSLKQQLLPSLEYPAAFIMAPYPGANPEIIEREVAEPIEDSVRGINGVQTISSTSRENLATVLVEFDFGTDLTIAVNQLQTAVNRISSQLPDNVDPTVFTGSTADLPVIVLAASGGGDEQQLAAKLDQTVVPQLRGVDGVRTVAVTGAREQNIVITPDPAKLAAARVQPTAIGTALQANGVAIPAGTVTEAEKGLTVQVGSRLTSLDELRSLPLATAGKKPVTLGDVATVGQKFATPTSYTRTDGVPSLGISVTATPDGNAVEISREISGMLADLSATSGTDLTVVFDQAPFVEQSIEALGTEGALGLVMAVLVILVFLLSVRSTLVTAVSIPLSVLVALIALWIGDHTLNMLTLGALTIAIGRVVDDSIVVLENIKRHLSYGEERRAAILLGVREVAGAVTASTLTTVAVFAPIALVGGFVGQLFAPFAITVTVALLASLLVSLTIVPVLAYWFLKPAGGSDTERAAVRRAAEEKERRNPLQRAYLPVIGFAVRRRWATVAIGLVVLLGTFALAGRLETNFIDESGQDTIRVTQKLPVGTSLAATDEAAQQVEAVLQRTEEIKSYQVTVGGGGMFAFLGGGGSNTASYSITLAEGHDAEEVGELLRDELGGLSGVGEIGVGAEGSPGFNASELQVIVKAGDPKALEAATEQVRQAFLDTPDIADVTTSAAQSVPRVEVAVNRAAATRVGLSEAAIGQTVAAAFRGSPLGQITLDGGTQNILLRFGAAPANLAEIQALPLSTPAGPIPLGQVAEVRQVDGPMEIIRIDGGRSITVSGTATRSDVGAVTAALTERLEALDLPGDASYELGGVSADQAEAFADLGLAVLAAIAIVFVIMVATFRSLIQPLILLVSIPFAATGAVVLLLATGTPLGVPALIGALMLVGIVVTNAIVLMDLINQYRAQGMGMREAVVEGGRHRLRPILMTALATIFALLPMAFGITGKGGFVSQSLAIVVIGGLLSSTLLTLVLVPALYAMVEGTKERWRERRGRGAVPALAGAAAYAGNDNGGLGSTAPSMADDSTDGEAVPRNRQAISRPTPSAALIDGTDQFEVLRLPKSQRSPLPPTEEK